MIKAHFYFDEAGNIRAFSFEGHAGYAEEGSDIVCAGLSMLGQTVIGTLDECLSTAPLYCVDTRKGRIAAELQDYDSYTETEKLQAKTLMFSAYIGVKQALANYGRWIQLVEHQASREVAR